jgi:hypothetical protein
MFSSPYPGTTPVFFSLRICRDDYYTGTLLTFSLYIYREKEHFFRVYTYEPCIRLYIYFIETTILSYLIYK